jgi:hypothetical protein
MFQRLVFGRRRSRVAPACSRWLAAAVLTAAGCAPRNELPVYPLYPQSAQPTAPESAARLVGPIAAVDGRDVSALSAWCLELLPGTHLVETRSDALDSTNYVTVVGRTGRSVFSLTMKSGHTYIVSQRVLADLSSRPRVEVVAEDHGPTGALDRVLHPSAAYAGDLRGITPLGIVETPDAEPRARGSESRSNAMQGERPSAFSPR